MPSLRKIASLFLICAAPMSLSAPTSAQSADEQELARDLSVAQKPIYDLGRKVGAKISVKAWVDQPSRIYTIGQSLRVSARADDDAHITIVNVGSSGRVNVLFPNHFQKKNKVKAGRTVSVPAEDARWSIQIDGPEGVDLIKVIASSEPLTLADLSRLGATTPSRPTISVERSADETARDLSVQLKPPANTAKARFGVANILIRIRK